MEKCRFLPVIEMVKDNPKAKEFIVSQYNRDKWEFAIRQCLKSSATASPKSDKNQLYKQSVNLIKSNKGTIVASFSPCDNNNFVLIRICDGSQA